MTPSSTSTALHPLPEVTSKWRRGKGRAAGHPACPWRTLAARPPPAGPNATGASLRAGCSTPQTRARRSTLFDPLTSAVAQAACGSLAGPPAPRSRDFRIWAPGGLQESWPVFDAWPSYRGTQRPAHLGILCAFNHRQFGLQNVVDLSRHDQLPQMIRAFIRRQDPARR